MRKNGKNREATDDTNENLESVMNALVNSQLADGNENHHYSALDLNQEDNAATTAEEIKRAYHSIARRLHPDKNLSGGNECGNEEFLRVKEAYRMLSDPLQKIAYDEALRRRLGKAEASSWIAGKCGGSREISRAEAVSQKVNLASMHSELVTDESGAEGKLYTCPCRCGDEFELYADEIEKKNSASLTKKLIECLSCNLTIVVFIGGED